LESGVSGDEVIRRYTTSSQCEVCGNPYQAEDVRIVGHDDEIWVLHVNCGSCHSQSLLAALMDENEAAFRPIEPLTDLGENETAKFEDIEITSNDVLDMFNFLKGFGGGFSQLFETK
jgi:hypothetical protein